MASPTPASPPPPTLLTLPIDILHLLLPYLDPLSLLNLTSTCRALHSPTFSSSAGYWSSRLRQDFRLPNVPHLSPQQQQQQQQRSPKRWRELYARLTRQTRAYTWGDNDHACLGQEPGAGEGEDVIPFPGAATGQQRRERALRKRYVCWPERMGAGKGKGKGKGIKGAVVDMQCGGWCTALFTSRGAVYVTGVLDGMVPGQREAARPTPLKFPIGFRDPASGDGVDPRTALRGFSVGRQHVLGVADDGRVWSWWSWEHAGVHVKLLQHDVREDGGGRGLGRVRKAVAGWNKSAVLIEGTGIVLWEPLRLESSDIGLSDAVLVLETQVVPRTGYSEFLARGKGPARGRGADDLVKSVGEVNNFIVLENVVVFCTTIGKAFASLITWTDRTHSLTEPVELPLPVLHPHSTASELESTFVTDVQGSFCSFAVLIESGAVLTSNEAALLPFLTAQTERQIEEASKSIFKQIPALQYRDVVSMAFGDHHFHALHASGHITSYGTEPIGCGALGLGGFGRPEGRLRGIRYSSVGGDGQLVPHAYTEGRRVWFEVEKRDWIQFLTSGGFEPEEAADRMRIAIGSPGVDAQGELSEWIEQEGRDWEEKFGLRGPDDDGLGAYFVLTVAAAGWHSGALVLENDELVSKLSAACEVEDPEQTTSDKLTIPSNRSRPDKVFLSTGVNWMLDLVLNYFLWLLGIHPRDGTGIYHDPHILRAAGYGSRKVWSPFSYGASPRLGFLYVWAKHRFPRLKLTNGVEMPGSVKFDEWRYGRPEWKLNWDEENDET